MLNIFEFSRVRENADSWLVYANKIFEFPNHISKLAPGSFSCFELRITVYCTRCVLIFTYELRVITYCTSYELIFTYKLRVAIYCASNNLLFIAQVGIDCVKFLY